MNWTRALLRKNPKDLLIDTLSCIGVLTLFSSVFISSYFDWALTSIISYPVTDGWCDTKVSGIGNHCFADFFAPVSIAAENPWDEGINPNPPTAMNIFRIFLFVSNHATNQVALLIWLSLISICLITPLIHLNRIPDLSIERKFKLNFIYLLSMPMITALDRGNIICLTIPLLYFYILNLENEKNSKKTVCLLIVASLIKPQLIIFSLLLFRRRNYSLIFKTLGAWIAITLVSFITYGDLFGDLRKYLVAVISYPDYASRGKIYPVNLSLRSTFDIANNATGMSINLNLITIASYFILLLFSFVTLRNMTNNSLSKSFFNLTLLTISFLGTSFSYYSTYLLLALLILILTQEEADIFSKRSLQLPILGIYLFVLPVNSLSWKIFPAFRDFGQTQISMTWALGQICIFLYISAELFLWVRGFIKIKKLRVYKESQSWSSK
jgi:hypothetical protein